MSFWISKRQNCVIFQRCLQPWDNNLLLYFNRDSLPHFRSLLFKKRTQLFNTLFKTLFRNPKVIYPVWFQKLSIYKLFPLSRYTSTFDLTWWYCFFLRISNWCLFLWKEDVWSSNISLFPFNWFFYICKIIGNWNAFNR